MLTRSELKAVCKANKQMQGTDPPPYNQSFLKIVKETPCKFNINSRNNSTSKYKQFLTLNVCFISVESQGKKNSSLSEGFLGAI